MFLRIVKLILLIGISSALVKDSPGQSCVTCATGCAETMPALVYGNLFCSCPTSSKCVDSGGICTTCTAGGPAYCWDTDNSCGGTYNNKGQNNCGCGGQCQS